MDEGGLGNMTGVEIANLFYHTVLEKLKAVKILSLQNASIQFEYSETTYLDTIRIGLPPLEFWKYCDPESLSYQTIWDNLALKLFNMTNIQFIKIEPIDSTIEEPWITVDIFQIIETWER